MTLRYLAAIGGNQPLDDAQPLDVLHAALKRIRGTRLAELQVSSLYRTPAFPPGSGPDFVNAAFAADSDLPPRAVLDLLHEIETEFGRTRTLRWGGRTLDLDLLAAGNTVAPDPVTWWHWHDLPADRQAAEAPGQMILPHPRMQDRAFVLGPLMDIAPDWRHPVLERSVAEMWADLPATERQSVVRLADSPCV
ncbi:2-amino-4-hydroxy-6-hydroxymethyldihydropteridine pyrophosphokinase [Oceanicola sp. 22II-s10i]|nr:2-amino-4-hydroxy-6-hydroxymethyldihydropteridine pyrophosphokinase [Oceanicola sp. 22II-s10i]